MSSENVTEISTKIHPRELIAFAFVEDAYSKTGDLVAGLVPLFVPILSKRANRRFEPVEFAAAVEKAYDIPMSPIVAAGLAEKLAEFKLLRVDPSEPRSYRVEPATTGETQINDSEMEQLLVAFSDFAINALKKIGLILSSDELQAAFLKRLTNVDFLSFVERREKNYYKGKKLVLNEVVDDEQDAVQIDQALDVLSAAFTLKIFEKGGPGADLITRLTFGALIAEVVLTLQVPSPQTALNGVSILFDGPLILDLLDLSTPELHDFSKDLFELVGKAGIQKFVFSHVISEMKGTLRGPLEAVQRNEMPFGPLGNRIRTDSSHRGYARATLDNLEAQLQSLGFEILDAGEYETDKFYSYCDPEVEEGLRNTLGPHHLSLERRIRDASSLATVLRLRDETKHKRSIAEAKWLFVTRNELVASKSREYLIYKNLLRSEDVPPALTDRKLAGHLWFAVGGNLGNLSSKKLIANCSYVMNPRTDLVSKVRQYLTDLDPNKAAIFVALMRDQRAQRCLVQSTMAFPSLVSLENVDELLDTIRASTSEEVRVAAEQREAEIKQEHEAKLAKLEEHHTNEALQRETQILLLQQQHELEKIAAESTFAQRDSQIEQLSSRLSQIEVESNADIDQRVQCAVAGATKLTKLLKIFVVVMYLVVAGALYWYAPTEKTVPFFAVTLALTALGFWKIPDYIFDKLRQPLWNWRFQNRCNELQVSKHLTKFLISIANESALRR